MKTFDFSSFITPVQEDSHLITYCFEMTASAWDDFSIIIVIIFFCLSSPMPLVYNRDEGNRSNSNPSTSNNQRTILFLFQIQRKKNHCSFSLFSALNVIHYGHFLCSCSSWGRSWFRWLIAEGSKSSRSDVHRGQESHSQFKPAAIFFVFLSQQWKRGMGVSWGCSAGRGWGVVAHHTKATRHTVCCFSCSSASFFAITCPIFHTQNHVP